MPQIVEADGVEHEFPDEATPDQITESLKSLKSPTTSSSTKASPDLSKYLAQPLGSAPMFEASEPQPKTDYNFEASRAQHIREILPSESTVDKVLQSVPTISPIIAALPEETRKQIIAGTEDSAAGLLDFTTSPAGIGTAVATALAPEIAVPAFAAHGLKSALSESVPALINSKNTREATSALEGLAMDAAMAAPAISGGLARPTELTPAHQAISNLVDQGHSLDQIEQAVNDHRQWTVSTTIGEPTPEQEAQRMLANMNERGTGPIIGKETQPLQPAPEGGEQLNATPEIQQQESVRQEPQDRTESGQKPETGTRHKLLYPEASEQEIKIAESSERSLISPSRRGGQPIVIDLLHKPKIFDSVISSVPVEMMNDFIGKEISSNSSFHDKAMFLDRLESHGNSGIGQGIVRSLASGIASLRAKLLTGFALGNPESVPAEIANNLDRSDSASIISLSPLSETQSRSGSELSKALSGTEFGRGATIGPYGKMFPAELANFLNDIHGNGVPTYLSESTLKTGDSLLGEAEKQVAADWTSATEESPSTEPATMKLGGEESGAIPSPAYPTRVMSELDQATAARSAKLQKSFDEAQRAQKEIKRVIPDKDRQRAATIYREANGDMATLQTWEANAKQDWMRDAAKTAQTLKPEEIAIVDKSKAAFDVLERRGNTYGVLTAHRDNYVPHIWEVSKDKGFTGSRRLQERFKFNKARTLDTFFDGDQAGLKPKDFALGNILPAYLSEMNKVIADRQFVEDLAKGTSKTGDPLAVPVGRVTAVTNPGGKAVLVTPKSPRVADTSDYRIMPDQPALNDWTWQGKDTDGNPVFVKADLALHPEAYRRVQAMLGKSPIREWYEQPSEGISQIPKAIMKGLDTAQSVMKREMFSLLSPFHQVQEGTHAIGHTVNPFFGIPEIDLRDPAQMDAARHGLMLLPDRTLSTMYMEGAGGKGGFVSQATRFVGEKLKAKAMTAVADVVDGYQDYLFHQYIPGLKFKTYQSILERNIKLYDSELKSGKLQEKDIKLLSAEQANAAYGHLNYDLLDRSPLMKHFAQLMLLAPDFFEARGRFLAQGLKTLTGSKAGWEQFRAIAILAMVQAGVAYTLSKLLGDEWDPKHPFEVRHGNRRYSMRSVPEDIASAITDSRKFMYGRINPLLMKGAVQGITGLNYRGEKVDFWKDTVPELLAQYIPISARNLPGLRNLTSSTRQNPVSDLEQFAGTAGLRISRYSPISDVYKRAGEWMDQQGIPRDKGSYPVSKYSKLRYALEDDDQEKAQEAYKELRKTMSTMAIGKGFIESTSHPFTKDKKIDVQFYRALDKDGKQVFDLAAKRRRELVWRFAKLPKQ